MGSLVRFGVKIIITVHRLLPDTEIKGSEKRLPSLLNSICNLILKSDKKVHYKNA